MDSHLLAYTISTTSPEPHRLSAVPFRIQIPSLLPPSLYESEFLREMRTTQTVRFLARAWQRVVTWSRRTFIGDRVISRLTLLSDYSYSSNSLALGLF
jgi:hypothetical protein